MTFGRDHRSELDLRKLFKAFLGETDELGDDPGVLFRIHDRELAGNGGARGMRTRSPRRTSLSAAARDMIAKPTLVATSPLSASGLVASMITCIDSSDDPALFKYWSISSRVPDPRLMYACSLKVSIYSCLLRASRCEGAQTTCNSSSQQTS